MTTPHSASTSTDSADLKPTLARLLESNGAASLTEDEARDAFRIVMSGHAEEAQIGALLSLIQRRGATTDELTGAARVMREHVVRLPIDETLAAEVVDTCGTGGAPKTFNISTAAAIVAAGAGAKVAKHGNRSRTGRGSAEILQALGVNVDASAEVQAQCLREAGICFSFAIHHHPAIKHAMPARRALGFPTMFNLLGPLTNPAGASRQLLGVYEASLTELMAGALAKLGAKHAMVVHGLDDGLDEMSTTAPTRISEVKTNEDGEGTEVETYQLDAKDFGIKRASLDDLKVETLEDGAQIIRDVLENTETGAAKDIVILNAAAALMVADKANHLPEALDLARESIKSGRAKATLTSLVKVSTG